MAGVANRSTKVRLEADITAFIADMERAGKVTQNVAEQTASGAKQAAAIQKRAQAEQVAAVRAATAAAKQAADEQAAAAKKGRQALDEVAQVAARGAVAVGAGLALTAKAAVDWESAWAGVAKTVDGTDAQLAELEDSLRGMAKTLPASHDEIAAVAEAAGQLGVKTADVAGFTETMIKLGATTNLSADEAATSIAQISNVMGTMDRLGTDGVDRFASALVALGNNGASTERDIVNMASRIAGAAKVVGLSEPDLLAVSNALASVGIEAEAGGTAFSNVLIDMSKAIKTGNSDLEGFARVAGMSTEQFAQAFEDRPAAAVDAFTQGLARIQQSGGDVFTVLSDLGQSDVRVTSALLKMAGSGDLLSQSLDDGTRAWEANSAMQAEFAKRAETTAAKMQVARNNIRDAAITIGDSLLPVLSSAATAGANLAQVIAGIPAPMRNAGLAVAGVGASGILAAAGIAKVVDIGKKAGDAFTYISQRGPRAAAAVDKVKGSAIGLGKVAGITLAAGTIGGLLIGDGSSYRGVDKITADILDSTDAIAAWDKTIADATSRIGLFHDESVNSFGDVLDAAFSPSKLQQVSSGLSGLFKTLTLGAFDNASAVSQADDALKQMDATLAALEARDPKLATEQFQKLAAYAKDNGVSLDQLMDKLPQYENAVAQAGNEAKAAGDKSQSAGAGVKSMGGAIDEAGKNAADAAKSLDDLSQSFSDLGAQLLGQRGSARDFQAAIDDATAAVKANGETLAISTEKGRANQAALDEIASATAAWASASVDAGASQEKVTSIMESGRAAFLKAAGDMGMGADEAARLADKLGLIPENVGTMYETSGLIDSQAQVEGYTEVINGVPTFVATTVSTPGSKTAQDEAAKVTEKLSKIPLSVNTSIGTPGINTAQDEADTLWGKLDRIPASVSSNVWLNGATTAAAQAWEVQRALLSIPRSVHGTITIDRYSRNIPVNEDGNLWNNGDVARVKAFASGGGYGISASTGQAVARVPQILAGGANVLWAEKTTGWEAYISGKPSERRRNLGIWAESGARLGVPPWLLELARVRTAFEGGGTVGQAAVPASMGGFDARAVAAVEAAVERGIIRGSAQVRFNFDGRPMYRNAARYAAGMERA